MDRVEIRELANSMIRLYGKNKAFALADRYAFQATALNDQVMHNRWAAVAALVGETLELAQTMSIERE